jgi:hypothetical protein
MEVWWFGGRAGIAGREVWRRQEALEQVEISGGGWRRSKASETVGSSRGGRRVWISLKGLEEVRGCGGGRRLQRQQKSGRGGGEVA